MDIKTLIENATNDDGVVDYDALNSQIDEQNNQVIKEQVTKQTGAIKSKAKAKARAQEQEVVENVQGSAQSSTNQTNNDDIAKLLKQMQEEIASLKSDSADSKQANFLKQGKSLGIDDAMLQTFVNSGADLDKIDLEQLAPKNKAKAPQTQQTEQNETKDVSDEAKRANLAQEILKDM